MILMAYLDFHERMRFGGIYPAHYTLKTEQETNTVPPYETLQTHTPKATYNAHCMICLVESPCRPVVTPCQHVSCYECLKSWLQDHPTCPMCRTAVVPAYMTSGK